MIFTYFSPSDFNITPKTTAVVDSAVIDEDKGDEIITCPEKDIETKSKSKTCQ